MGDPVHVRLLALLLRLYPTAVRRRFEGEILASARAAAAAGRGRPAAVLLDGAATLVRAWAAVVARGLAGVRPGRALEALARDGALALRGVRRRPLQGVVVVGTLALALGANGAVYTVTHAVLLRTLPYDGAERIMAVAAPPLAMYRVDDGFNWRAGAELVEAEGVEAAATYFEDAGANLMAGDDASRVRLAQVSGDFFRVMGVRMHLGHGITPADEGQPRAVLGWELWWRAYGGDPGVLGRTIHLSGHPYVVTGVAPPEVDFPGGTELWASDPPVADFYGAALGPSVVARIRPGARPLVEAALERWDAAERAEAGEGGQYYRTPGLDPLLAHITEEVRVPLLLLAGAAAVVLLLGCVNVAGVLLARVAGRRPELAMRRALGAGRGRLFGQLMAETLVLALLAGVLSVVLAAAAVPLLRGFLPAGTPRLESIRPGALTLAFAAAATVVAGLLAGLAPAAAAAAGGAHPDRRRPDTRRGQRVLGALTSFQVALAMVLVVAAVLLGRSLAELRAVPLGYDTEGVLTLEVRLPLEHYPDPHNQLAYVEDVSARLARLPGVVAVGASSRLPLTNSMGRGMGVRPAEAPPETDQMARFAAVTPGWFAAMGIPLVAGTTLSSADAADVILSAEVADSLFGNAPAAVGREVSIGRRAVPGRVVGVVGNVRYMGPEDPSRRALYVELADEPVTWPGFTVRVAGDPAELMPAVRAVLREVDASVPPFALRTTGAAVGEELAARRAVAVMAELFGVAALLLAVLALYGLLAQGVAQRRRELGVRLALGATGGQVMRLVLRRGLGFAAMGLVVGAALSLAAVRLVEGILFQVPARDPGILLAAAAVVAAAAVAASWWPARRAARTDPALSLRGE